MMVGDGDVVIIVVDSTKPTCALRVFFQCARASISDVQCCRITVVQHTVILVSDQV